ncbi:MAG TPA: DNA polymerase III subunit gamma/tau [Candidatus Acidoferrales bacterium]|nr:DNA polymerase III subunit gamma/tau [Candidatus Acidoferrales bacterium]
MAHRALTLKYRPQVFADLIGQDHVTSVLGKALESGRIAHAFLFTGARGVGKTTSARILAKALNCERRARAAAAGGAGPDPCNACTSCTEITAGVSLDVVEIDGASNRGIADVQQLREKVRFAPTMGRYRVVIIDEVHQLSGDAFAALLKTLEEPPAHLVFIFATTDPQKLPDTIRSRTQRFDFARVPLRKVADRLLEIQRREAADPEGARFELADAAALLIAHKGEGSMRDSVSALDQVVSAGEPRIDEPLVRRVLGIADREAFFRLGETITQRDPKATLAELHRAFETGLDPRDLAEGLAEHFRALLVMKIDPEHGGDLLALGAEDLKRLLVQGEAWSETDLLRLVRIAAECQWPLRDSPQPIVHLEAAVLQMVTLEPAESVALLIERLEALERRLAGGSAPPPRGPAGPAGGGVRAGAGAPAAAPARAPLRAAPSASSQAPPAVASARAASPPATAATTPPAPASGAGAAASTATLAPAEAPAAGAGLDELTERRWQATIAAVNARKRMLGAFLEECRLIALEGNALVLAMDDLHRAVVDASEHRALVREELERVFGAPLQLRCAPLGASEAPRPATEADVRPLIERAIEFFDGEVIERPATGERSA